MTYIEKERSLPVAGEYDVIVCGSGPAGVCAAVKAGRMGMKVLVIEYFGSVGGMSTSGLMSHWTGSVRSNLYTEILTRMADENEGEKRGKITNQIDPEKLKGIYLDMLRDAGADILLYTFVCGAIVEDGAVKGVITESKSGRRAFTAKVTVDGTGDGDVAAYAGVPYEKGRESDGRMQPCTLMFKVGGGGYGPGGAAGVLRVHLRDREGRAAGAGEGAHPISGGASARLRQSSAGDHHLQHDELHRDRRHEGRGSYAGRDRLPLADAGDSEVSA